jgi:hypothetical protein
MQEHLAVLQFMTFLGFRSGLWPSAGLAPSWAFHRFMHNRGLVPTKFQLPPDRRTRRTIAYAIMTKRLCNDCTLPQPRFNISHMSDPESRQGTFSDGEVYGFDD